MKRDSFSVYYYVIERSIVKNSNGKTMTGKQMACVLGNVCVLGTKLASKLLRERVRKNPKLGGKIDTCWLTIFSVALVAYCWSSAVSRGKAFDRKRDKKGRLGWIGKHDELPSIMSKAYDIGEEIVNQRLANDRDFDSEIEVERLTKALISGHSNK